MMWWWGGDHLGTGGWIGMGFMILFWIAVVVGIVYLVRYAAGRSGPDRTYERPPSHWQARGQQESGVGKSEAIRILEERYARGEIDQEEFLKRKADLSS
jgi:putative membrane protein